MLIIEGQEFNKLFPGARASEKLKEITKSAQR